MRPKGASVTTLKDVARHAGVSPSTVSYVFNGKKKVRPETAKRIYDAIEALDYHPNFAARSLKTSHTNSVGIVIPDFSNIFYVDVLSGIESRLVQDGYSSIVSNSRNSADAEREILESLVHRSIDGIILLGTGTDTAQTIAELAVPVVSVDRVTAQSVNSVSVDNEMGGYLGARYLLDKGLRNITFIGFNEHFSSGSRREGCLKAYAEVGIDPEPHFRYIETEISPEHGYQITMDLFADTAERRIEAIFAGTDYVAFGVLRALSDLDVAVPGDVAVVGYDDLLLSQFTVPRLTTIGQPARRMGIAAADMLLGLLHDDRTTHRLTLQPTLVVRDSA
jgi:LacI family transcriptional regulator